MVEQLRWLHVDLRADFDALELVAAFSAEEEVGCELERWKLLSGGSIAIAEDC